VIDRRTFIGSIAGSLVALPLAAQAQQAGRVYRLGLLSPGMPSTSGAGMAQWLSSYLGELGYVEGRNLVVVARFAEERADRMSALARELAQQKLDVIVAIGTSAIQASKIATATVPIVFLTNGDPVELGLVASLARPGGNVTGILIAPGGTLAGKKLELLKEMVPRATRIALLTPDDPGAGLKMQVQEVRKSAAVLGVELSVVEVRSGDYAKAFAAIGATRSTALFVGATSRFLRDRDKIIELAASHRLPAIYEWPQQVKDGGLMSYGASDTETYRRVAVYVGRIFKGAAPGELPIEQPSKLMLVINLKTAKAMGLSIPQSLLLRADEVIQ
jgi:putative tryptophan/tyrosine transport system substrate-binding protein